MKYSRFTRSLLVPDLRNRTPVSRRHTKVPATFSCQGNNFSLCWKHFLSSAVLMPTPNTLERFFWSASPLFFLFLFTFLLLCWVHFKKNHFSSSAEVLLFLLVINDWLTDYNRYLYLLSTSS